VVSSTLLRTGQLVPYYIFTTYILAYGANVLGLNRATLLACLSLRSFTSVVMIPAAGYISDVYGRRKVVATGLIGISIFSFVYFGLLETRSIPLILLAMVIDSLLQDMQYAPQAALIAESFPASRRYSGSGLGYHLAAITAGGPAPLVATFLYETFQTPIAISVFVAISAAISLGTLFFLRDHSGELDHR
jgi:sugar phosphate permease